MSKDPCHIVSAYHAQAVRDIICGDEILSGREQHEKSLNGLVEKYKETAAKAEKERNSKFCDKAYVARCEHVMKEIAGILERQGIKVR